MKLDAYRKQRGWSYVDLAELTGASHATVARRWCLPHSHRDYKIPAQKFMNAILVITDGAVQPNSFYQIGLDD